MRGDRVCSASSASTTPGQNDTNHQRECQCAGRARIAGLAATLLAATAIAPVDGDLVVGQIAFTLRIASELRAEATPARRCARAHRAIALLILSRGRRALD